MRPAVPQALTDRASEWNDLHRRERSELGKSLRRLGLTYGEIRSIIPVPKTTLSGWCRDVELTAEQIAAIRRRTGPGSRAGTPVDTQWRRREEVRRIRDLGRLEVPGLMEDPLWVAGVMLYWAEGGKTKRNLEMANTDPDVLRIFIAWVRAHLDPNGTFVLSLHLHEGNNEAAARRHWEEVLNLTGTDWTRTFVKPGGTGHRKNKLSWGVCRVRVRRSADAFIRTMAWIDELRSAFPEMSHARATIHTHGSLAQSGRAPDS